MLKRLFAIGLAVVFFHAGNSLLLPDLAHAQQTPVDVEKIKTFVAARGTGPKAKITVKLKDKTKLKGYISASGADSFTVADSDSGQTRTLAYTDVAEVKKPGGLSLGAKIGIGIGAGVGVLALLYAIGCSGDDAIC